MVFLDPFSDMIFIVVSIVSYTKEQQPNIMKNIEQNTECCEIELSLCECHCVYRKRDNPLLDQIETRVTRLQ